MPGQGRETVSALLAAAEAFGPAEFAAAAGAAVATNAAIRFCHPFGEARGLAGLTAPFAAMHAAMPDAERRMAILVEGRDEDGALWLGCCGHWCGTFRQPFLGIPPTDQLATMRFHEFYRVEENRIVEVQAVWDIPELMMQAHAWPMAPSLGREGVHFGPQTQDGLGPHDHGMSAASRDHVVAMLTAMSRHPSQGGPEVMELERFWHPRFNWYGPAGIGASRGVAGFRRRHQIPFLAAMPDRGLNREGTNHHFFAEGAYVGVTGWPNMRQTITGDGWLGIAPAGQEVTLRSLDFWRLEGGLIRENWVLVDLLDIYRQIGVDVLARMRELGRGRASLGAAA